MRKFLILLLVLVLCLCTACKKSNLSEPMQTPTETEASQQSTPSEPEMPEHPTPSEPETNDGMVSMWHLEEKIVGAPDDYQSSYLYFYDENGAEVRREQYSNGQLFLYYTYTYDQAGNELTRTQFDPNGTENWIYDYTYDENGNKIQMLRYEDGTLTEKYIYSYNEQGDLAETLTYFGADDNKANKTTYEYTYTNGKVVECSTYQDGRHSNTKKYTYTENGTLFQEETWTDGVMTMCWTYNEDGTPAEMEWTIKDSVSQRVFTYDENGNMIQRQVYRDGVMTEDASFSYKQIPVLPEMVQIVTARQQELLKEYQ